MICLKKKYCIVLIRFLTFILRVYAHSTTNNSQQQIALAENAVDNGVELRIRTKVTQIEHQPASNDDNDGLFTVTLQHWEPEAYLKSIQGGSPVVRVAVSSLGFTVVYVILLKALADADGNVNSLHHGTLLVGLYLIFSKVREIWKQKSSSAQKVARNTPLTTLVQQAGAPCGTDGAKVSVDDMLVGGSGAPAAVGGIPNETTQIRCRYVINCAGGASDQVARLIGDDSFQIKPRLGDYILLNRNQVRACVLNE